MAFFFFFYLLACLLPFAILFIVYNIKMLFYSAFTKKKEEKNEMGKYLLDNFIFISSRSLYTTPSQFKNINSALHCEWKRRREWRKWKEKHGNAPISVETCKLQNICYSEKKLHIFLFNFLLDSLFSTATEKWRTQEATKRKFAASKYFKIIK